MKFVFMHRRASRELTRACIVVLALMPFQRSVAQTRPAAAAGAPPRLLPEPRQVEWEQARSIGSGIRIVSPVRGGDDDFTREDLAAYFESHAVAVKQAGAQVFTIELLPLENARSRHLLQAANLEFAAPMQSEGYAIVPTPQGIAIIGKTSAGLFYGAQTAKQLVTGAGKDAMLHAARILDWPAMQYRGMDDDLSRGPVPTLAFQKQQLRIFAAYKLNVYSPYFENTFQYTSNPLSAMPGGAMTAAEYSELCQYAARYHITVVPEQEAFGHLHNVLNLEQYAGLAETPHGAVLAPGNPEVMPLIKQWFSELAELTPGPFLHLGADETDDLGRGKTHDAVQQRGLGPVYSEFLTQINSTLKPLKKRILFWGDIAVNQPKLVPLLPKDMIAVPWDYDLSPNGYEHEILPFKQAGMETWVAPGVNNWNRVYPDYNVSLLNIQGFLRDGQKLGSTGALNTAWNDDGEGLFNLDWYGVVFGAAASWQPGEISISAYQASYGQVFHGDDTGKIDQAQQELMFAHALLRAVDDRGASDFLFWVDPWSPDGQAAAVKIRPILHELRIHAEHAQVLLAEARAGGKLRQTDALAAMELGARRMDIIGMKFQLSDEIIGAYARALRLQSTSKNSNDVDIAIYEISDTNGRCQDIRNGYSLTRDLFEEAWLRENRPFWLHNVLARYDLGIQLWTQRGNAVASALNQWHRDHTLPAAGSAGMPPAE